MAKLTTAEFIEAIKELTVWSTASAPFQSETVKYRSMQAGFSAAEKC